MARAIGCEHTWTVAWRGEIATMWWLPMQTGAGRIAHESRRIYRVRF